MSAWRRANVTGGVTRWGSGIYGPARWPDIWHQGWSCGEGFAAEAWRPLYQRPCWLCQAPESSTLPRGLKGTDTRWLAYRAACARMSWKHQAHATHSVKKYRVVLEREIGGIQHDLTSRYTGLHVPGAHPSLQARPGNHDIRIGHIWSHTNPFPPPPASHSRSVREKHYHRATRQVGWRVGWL